jgi:hypothetical protein
MRLMKRIRDSINGDCFPQFVRSFVLNYYSKNKSKETENSNGNVPEWVLNALKKVNIDLLDN